MEWVRVPEAGGEAPAAAGRGRWGSQTHRPPQFALIMPLGKRGARHRFPGEHTELPFSKTPAGRGGLPGLRAVSAQKATQSLPCSLHCARHRRWTNEDRITRGPRRAQSCFPSRFHFRGQRASAWGPRQPCCYPAMTHFPASPLETNGSQGSEWGARSASWGEQARPELPAPQGQLPVASCQLRRFTPSFCDSTTTFQ